MRLAHFLPKELISVIGDPVCVPYFESTPMASVHGYLLWPGLPAAAGVSSLRGAQTLTNANLQASNQRPEL